MELAGDRAPVLGVGVRDVFQFGYVVGACAFAARIGGKVLYVCVIKFVGDEHRAAEGGGDERLQFIGELG